jgi:CheY-like chemotaxis protein
MSLANPKMAPPGTRLLLVDDNESGLAARKSVLEELGYWITTAIDPIEGLAYFGQGVFSIVITDYKMPKMNGPQFIEKLRELDPALPIILISGFVDSLGLSEASTGADIVIQKSSNEVSHLLRAVARLMKRKTPKKPPASQASHLLVKVKKQGV